MLSIFWPPVGPIDNEFFNLYAGLHVGPQFLYHPERFARFASLLHADVMAARLYYCRMPYYTVLTAPLAWLSFPAALAVWQTTQALALFTAALLWPAGRLTLFAVTLLSLPAVCAFVTVQDVSLMLLFAAAATALAVRGRSAAAGAVFSLCLMKPHLVFLVPLVMAVRKDYRFFYGAAAGGIALLSLSFAVGPANWPAQWLASITNPLVSPFSQGSPGLREFLRNGAWLPALAIAATLVFAVWRCARLYPVERSIAVALAAGVVVNVHSLAVDCILLIPAAAMAIESKRALERVLGLYLALPLAYLSLMMGNAIWVRSTVMALVYVQAIGYKPRVGEFWRDWALRQLSRTRVPRATR